MRKLTIYLRLLSFLPAVLLMIGIYWFSAQPADDSSQISISFSFILIRNFLGFLWRQASEADLYQLAVNIHGIIRKLAHFTEYFVLASFCYLPCIIYRKSGTRIKGFVLLFCFLYACTDELHQAFVPGRACRLLDVGIDTSGALLALLILTFLSMLFHLCKKHFHH